MFSLVLAFAGALALQTPPDTSGLPPEQAKQVNQVFAGMTRMFETLGTCERQFPPDVAQEVRAALANETDPEKKAASEFLLAAYEKGKASPRAATISSALYTVLRHIVHFGAALASAKNRKFSDPAQAQKGGNRPTTQEPQA
jgi:hypothetical protein